MTKLGTAFHETFRLVRPYLSQILQVISDSTKSLTLDDFEKETTLGRNQIKSARRYAYGAGLVDESEKITLFGSMCLEHDLEFAKAETQWLLHYHLAVPYGAGPKFWNAFFQTQLPKQIDRTRLAEMIQSLDATPLAPGTYSSAATIFAGTYSASESLGPLGFLKEESQGSYSVTEPVPIGTGAFACVLAEYWEHEWNERDTVLLNEVTQGPFARLLCAEGTLGETLRALEKRQLISLQRRTSPFSVTRRWTDVPSVWLSQLYSD